MSHTTDVAIIGGGVIGCSIAYQLSKKGIKSTVFEKNKLASGASGATAGIIGPIWYLDHTIKPYFDMGMRSLEIFPSFVEELKEAGIDPEFQQNGGMKIVLDEDTNTLLRGNLQWQKELGIGVRWIDKLELLEREPEITDRAEGGVFSPQDASIKGAAYTNSLAHASTRLGTTYLEGLEVTGLETHRGTVIGVKTQSGTFHANHTIIAAGAWSGISRRWFSSSIPILPIKGQRIILRKQGFLPKCTVQSIVPQTDGSILSAATREEGVFNHTITGEAISQMVSAAKMIFPTLNDAEFVSAKAGVRPGSPDGMPILGPIPEWLGVSIASGHDHVGMICSPATAELVSEYVATGNTSGLEPFSITRFETGTSRRAKSLFTNEKYNQ